MQLVSLIYDLTKNFPQSEQFGLVKQMRTAAISIPSNIAEGRSRGTRKDYRRFVLIAFASASELETQLLIAQNLHFGDKQKLTLSLSLVLEILRMLNTTIISLDRIQ